MRFNAAAVAPLLALVAAQSEDKPRIQAGEPVKAPAGIFVGTESWFRPGVSAYLGIPYAQPPVGPLRFQPPAKLNETFDAYQADKIPDDCPTIKQPPFANEGNVTSPAVANVLLSLGQANTTMSEDCLKLNVWTKGSGENSAKKAVMVWIHGGGFFDGSSGISLYDGSAFADDEDVVFVSINYRLNILGFSGAPGVTPNIGLLDQRAALEWVRDNIEAFGGDPERIVIQGESAGAGSVDLWTYAWKEDPIVSGIIAESGSAGLGGKPGNDSWFAAAKNAGCSDAAESVACMTAKSIDEVMEAVRPLRSSRLTGSFGPQTDGKVIFDDYAARGKAGDFAHVPMLVGNNNHEQGLYAFIESGNIPQATLDAMIVQFTCGSGTAAKYREDAGVPVWRYRYYGDFPNVRFLVDSGAYHTSEIFTLFGTAEPVSKEQNTPSQQALGDYMRKAWATFAKDPVNGLKANMSWPTYDDAPGSKTVVRLGYNNETTASFAGADEGENACHPEQMAGGPLGGGSVRRWRH